MRSTRLWTLIAAGVLAGGCTLDDTDGASSELTDPDALELCIEEVVTHCYAAQLTPAACAARISEVCLGGDPMDPPCPPGEMCPPPPCDPATGESCPCDPGDPNTMCEPPPPPPPCDPMDPNMMCEPPPPPPPPCDPMDPNTMCEPPPPPPPCDPMDPMCQPCGPDGNCDPGMS